METDETVVEKMEVCHQRFENDRGMMPQYLTALQSETKSDRKKALQNINKEIFENNVIAESDIPAVFVEVYSNILYCFADASEACREVSITIISNFIEKLPLNDYYLSEILPVIARRFGSPLVEESEEIRLVLMKLVHSILRTYKHTDLLAPFIEDFTSILTTACNDKFPNVKLEACECIVELTEAIPQQFHGQSKSYVQPVLSNFGHQHYRVRVTAVKAIGAIVIAGNVKCFELSINSIGDKLFDENLDVRLQVAKEVGNWMLTYKERYSFWHRLIPLLLTCQSDAMIIIKETATELWEEVGKQYMEENEEALKRQADFLHEPPKHYPNISRPNLGCRTLVMSNFGKIMPIVCREISVWQAEVRLRVAQLLSRLLECAEDGAAQHAPGVARTLMRGAADDTQRVLQEIKYAAEIFGYFTPPTTWWPLLAQDIHLWPTLLVLTHILKGAQAQQVIDGPLGDICKALFFPHVCRVDKADVRLHTITLTETLVTLCDKGCLPYVKELFDVTFTALSMAQGESVRSKAVATIKKLAELEMGEEATIDAMYERHVVRVLAALKRDVVTWTMRTPERNLLEYSMTGVGPALGSYLHLVGPLVKKVLTTEYVKSSVKLSMFKALFTVLNDRHSMLANCGAENLEVFYKIVVEEVILLNLVWSAGQSAEAQRAACVACLCAALHAVRDDPAARALPAAPGEYIAPEVLKIYPTKEAAEKILKQAVPLVLGVVDERISMSRRSGMRALCALAELAHRRGVYTAEMLHKIYYPIMRRMDDSDRKVRCCAVLALSAVFALRPLPYDSALYGAHLEAVYSAALLHLDDSDPEFRDMVLDALIKLSDIDPDLLLHKLNANYNLYMNKEAFDTLSKYIKEKR